MKRFLVLGILYACGSIKWGRNYAIEFQTKRGEFASFLEDLFSDFEPKVSKSGKNRVISVTGKEKLRNILGELKIEPPLEKEKIPLRRLNSTEKKMDFLRGFFEGKSSILPKKKQIKVSGKIEQLKGLKNLLGDFQVLSNIYTSHGQSVLVIKGQSRCDNFKKIGFLTEEKNEALGKISLFEKIEPT